MSDDAPGPVPPTIRDELAGLDAPALDAVADYARSLAEQRRGTDDGEDTDDQVPDPPDDWDAEEWEAAIADADAPPKASLTVKTINENRYYYLQWRDGDSIRSAYVGPVSSST